MSGSSQGQAQQDIRGEQDLPGRIGDRVGVRFDAFDDPPPTERRDGAVDVAELARCLRVQDRPDRLAGGPAAQRMSIQERAGICERLAEVVVHCPAFGHLVRNGSTGRPEQLDQLGWSVTRRCRADCLGPFEQGMIGTGERNQERCGQAGRAGPAGGFGMVAQPTRQVEGNRRSGLAIAVDQMGDDGRERIGHGPRIADHGRRRLIRIRAGHGIRRGHVLSADQAPN